MHGPAYSRTYNAWPLIGKLHWRLPKQIWDHTTTITLQQQHSPRITTLACHPPMLTLPITHSPRITTLASPPSHHHPPILTLFQGRVRTKTVKKAARVIIEKYYPRLTLDFQTNKKIADEVAIIASKRLRNKIAGFTTHLMKRIQRGPVRGISFKLQEEERERKDNYVPEISALAIDSIEIDLDTAALLKAMNFDNLANIQVVSPSAAIVEHVPGGNQKGARRD